MRKKLVNKILSIMLLTSLIMTQVSDNVVFAEEAKKEVIILSVSSSKASSSFLIAALTSGTLVICSVILESFSSNFMEKNLFCSSDTPRSIADTLLMASSTLSSNLWTTACDFLPAILTALSAASRTPVPFSAEISTTSHPRLELNFSGEILSPFLLTRSIIFTAITTGIPSSIN